jgi:hypothetical protein
MADGEAHWELLERAPGQSGRDAASARINLHHD